MTLVRNHLLQLSGNKIYFYWFFIGLIFLGSCAPKKILVNEGTEPTVEKVEEKVVEEKVVEEVIEPKSVALLLPFQLHKMNKNNPNSQDVERATLALDFYQGFELGLQNWVNKGANLTLEVLDSQDSDVKSNALGKEAKIVDFDMIVGPVYPKEIKSFQSGLKSNAGFSKKTLHISPLAATMPSEFNFPNLISLTPPILIHIRSLAKRIVEDFQPGDAILFYHTEDASNKQFAPLLKAELSKLKSNLPIYNVQNEEELAAYYRTENVTNFVISGTDNRFQVARIAEEVHNLYATYSSGVKLIGHPNWARMNISNPEVLAQLNTEITSSHYVSSEKEEDKKFVADYRSKHKVPPTDFAYKGYDIGSYVGYLFFTYGDDYRENLVDTTFEGLHNSIELIYNSASGYINNHVYFLQFENNKFRLKR